MSEQNAHPELEVIQLFPEWEFWWTGTYKGTVPKLGRQWQHFNQWLRCIAKTGAVPFQKMKWALRMEKGERHGRDHLHCLIGHTNMPLNTRSAFQLQEYWERHAGGGFSRCSVIRPDDSGVTRYLCKDKSQPPSDGGLTEKQQWELAKFGWANENPPKLSRSLLGYVARKREFRDLLRLCEERAQRITAERFNDPGKRGGRRSWFPASLVRQTDSQPF